MKLRIIGVAFTFVGAIVGAGFASGREIALYFSHTSIITPLLAGTLLSVLFYFFLSMGRVTKGDLSLLGKKTNLIVAFIIKICSFITVIAMIAGSEEIVFSLVHFHGGSVITGVLALVVVLFGVEKIKASNIFIVPVIIVLITVIFFKEKTTVPFEKLSVVPAFTYSAMNVIGAGYFTSFLAKDFDKKECLLTAIIGGGITTALLLFVFFSIQDHLDSAMPLLEAAKDNNFTLVGNVIAYLSIFSTLTGSLSISCDNKPFLAIILTSVAFVLSVFGFRAIVDKCYPIIGAIGGVVTLVYLFLFLKFLRSRKKIPEAIKPRAIKTIT